MKREEIVALLKTWGVKVADDATDEWLKTELAKGKPAKIEPAPVTDPNPLAAKLANIEAQLEKERRGRVSLQIDKLILEGRVSVAERDAETVLCIADESRLAILAKRPQANLGAEPLAGIILFGDAGPMDAVKAKKKGKERFHFMRDNWSDLRAALPRQLPNAANTVDSALVTQMLVEGATTVLQNRLAPLRAFAKEVSIDRIKPLAVLQHRKVTAGGTAQTNATSFEDTTNFVGANDNVAITMAQITTGKHVTNAERQSGHAMEFWADVHAAEIADKMIATITATILVASFTATPLVSAAPNFGGAELAILWGQLKKSPIKNIILDGEYYANFLPTDRFDFAVTEFRNRGWDNFLLNTVWTGATANTVGFACNPQAIVVGLGLPIRDPQADTVSTESLVSLPEIGVSVSFNMWYSNITRATWATYDVMIGATANDTTAGVIIKSA